MLIKRVLNYQPQTLNKHIQLQRSLLLPPPLKIHITAENPMPQRNTLLSLFHTLIKHIKHNF
ncbi:hypothetical protein Lalb_Chr15g0084881 [Lupinus albus]|uniref:Uncharacterized protein n=1 Tax=Lupinus albus TaxID=3870 RepID=A0A6A4P265_LUPAL|nr:hypothetical protein Lalb_Chr15g0084881 [Lupinus albus]